MPVVDGAAVDEQQVVVAAVGVEPGGEDSARRSFLPTRTIAPAPSPNRTQVAAVLPVEHPAEGLGADHQRLVRSCPTASIESATLSA